ncbi:MAG TPA: AtpZ/AtpI family protein [Myxococcota bacterium]|nr:AtpZ/AtpI family protein [Myxococcota bacterium]
MDDDEQKRREKTAQKLKSWQASQAKAYRTYIKTSAVGLEFGLAIAVGALLGYFADKYFSSSPYCLLAGVMLGTIAGVKRLWVFMKSYLEKSGRDDDE